MTKAMAKRWLRAVNKLIEIYKKGMWCFGGCPLCNLVSRTEHCQDCLWYIYEGCSCCNPKEGMEELDADRIKRLNRWKARLNKIIGGK